MSELPSASQAEVKGAPGYRLLGGDRYYRLVDREYFRLLAGTPLD